MATAAPSPMNQVVMDCKICGWQGDSYLPRFGDTGRLCVCPKCRSLDRNRHLFDVIASVAGDLSPETTILDIAPSIALLRELATRTNYVGVDYAPTSALVMQADARRLPFADQSFDVLLCSHVLEHIRDDAAAMAEIRRMIRPGGYAFVQVPHFNWPRTEELEEVDRHGHVRNYARDDFVSRMTNAGFHVDPVNLHDPAQGEQHRYDHYDVFVCTTDHATELPPVNGFVEGLNRAIYRGAADQTTRNDIPHPPLAT